MLDIACMKLSAIASRGSKKDFIDFAFILKQFSLPKLLESYHQKDAAGDLSNYQLLKSLIYFTDAEKQPLPTLLSAVSWQIVKDEITAAVKCIFTVK